MLAPVGFSRIEHSHTYSSQIKRWPPLIARRLDRDRSNRQRFSYRRVSLGGDRDPGHVRFSNATMLSLSSR
jgi:hypothetical protein